MSGGQNEEVRDQGIGHGPADCQASQRVVPSQRPPYNDLQQPESDPKRGMAGGPWKMCDQGLAIGQGGRCANRRGGGIIRSTGKSGGG